MSPILASLPDSRRVQVSVDGDWLIFELCEEAPRGGAFARSYAGHVLARVANQPRQFAAAVFLDFLPQLVICDDSWLLHTPLPSQRSNSTLDERDGLGFCSTIRRPVCLSAAPRLSPAHLSRLARVEHKHIRFERPSRRSAAASSALPGQIATRLASFIFSLACAEKPLNRSVATDQFSPVGSDVNIRPLIAPSKSPFRAPLFPNPSRRNSASQLIGYAPVSSPFSRRVLDTRRAPRQRPRRRSLQERRPLARVRRSVVAIIHEAYGVFVEACLLLPLHQEANEILSVTLVFSPLVAESCTDAAPGSVQLKRRRPAQRR